MPTNIPADPADRGHPTYLDLNTGPDQRVRRLEWLAWATAAFSWLGTWSSLDAIPFFAGCAALAWLLPRGQHAGSDPGPVRLFRDGTFLCGEREGQWLPASWHTSWLSVIRIRVPGQRNGAPRHLVICPGRNREDSWRRLSTWLRWCPHGGPEGGTEPQGWL